MNRSDFMQAASASLFGGAMTASQAIGVNSILDAWVPHSHEDIRWLSYMLATAYHETAKLMQPCREWGEGKGKTYGTPAGPYQQVFYGRGLVQLTWYANYAKATSELRSHGIMCRDLTQYPDDALLPDIAAAVMMHGMIDGWFTGDSLPNHFSPGDDNDDSEWVLARRIINGLDCAEQIAGYGHAFHAALVDAGA